LSESGYTFLDQLLHRLALQFDSIAEMSFDLDQKMVRFSQDKIASKRHVFVSGLARAGTTVLMRRFHSTGLYRSLTYRDMPFVLAPNLWRRISLISKRQLEYVERAHGDNLLVDADSPESFDEVFWRVFAGNQYLEKAYLKPHEPSRKVIDKYILYVNAILSSQSPPKERYLSKNNNNILRLGAIQQAFPNALILVPFREPFQHALSLLRQHHNFSELQKNNKFTLSYMTWIGHHEFGLDHRPFQFRSATPPESADTLDYWLHLWCDTYAWLEESKPKSALFICYEDLCRNDELWTRLAALAGVDANLKTGDPFKLSIHPVDADVNQDLAIRASALYSRLVAQARAQLRSVQLALASEENKI
jgi:hypothetical protein